MSKEDVFLPPGECIMSNCSPFYRSDLSDSYLSPRLCEESDDENCDQHHHLKFPKTLQVSYDSKTILSKLDEIKLIQDERLGRH